MTFIQDIENEAISLEHQLANWFNTNPVGQMIEADAKACITALEKIAKDDLTQAITAIGVAILAGLASGGTEGAIAAGIVAAEEEFKYINQDLQQKTITTLVTTITNQVNPTAAQIAK
jgi:urease accessory protein UreF